jgi:hypothetical protein
MLTIEVSCPVCNANNIIEMELYEPKKGSLSELLLGVVGDIGIKHYTFVGEGKCSKCRKGIEISLNVLGGKVDHAKNKN